MGRSPRFLDNPCVRAPLADPGGTSAPDHAALRWCLPVLSNRRLPQLCLSVLSHAARTLPVYASPRQSPDTTQHSVPDGGQPCPVGALTRWVALRLSCLHHTHLSRLRLAHDRKHQCPSNLYQNPPEASIQRRHPPRQLVTSTRSTLQRRQRPQKSPCGSSRTEPSLPVALLASDMLLQVHRYRGPLAERDSDASTRIVAGGITTVRSCIACPHFGSSPGVPRRAVRRTRITAQEGQGRRGPSSRCRSRP